MTELNAQVNKLAQGGLVLAALLVAERMQLKRSFWFHLSQGERTTFALTSRCDELTVLVEKVTRTPL